MKPTKSHGMTIGDNIRSVRKRANLTQEELARKAGIATITLRQYENGKRQPKVESLKKIASVFDMSVSDFIDGATDAEKTLNIPNSFAGMSTETMEKIENNLDIAHTIATIIESKNETVEILVNKGCDGNCGNAMWAFVDIVNAYNKLNAAGRNEALKRIHELTFIPDYQREEK